MALYSRQAAAVDDTDSLKVGLHLEKASPAARSDASLLVHTETLPLMFQHALVFPISLFHLFQLLGPQQLACAAEENTGPYVQLDGVRVEILPS